MSDYHDDNQVPGSAGRQWSNPVTCRHPHVKVHLGVARCQDCNAMVDHFIISGRPGRGRGPRPIISQYPTAHMPATRAEHCRRLLTAAGRPDMAHTIGTNKLGHPMRGSNLYQFDDALLVHWAFRVVHGPDPMYFATLDPVAALVDHVTTLQMPARELGVDDPERPPHWSYKADDWVATYDDDEWRQAFAAGLVVPQ